MTKLLGTLIALAVLVGCSLPVMTLRDNPLDPKSTSYPTTSKPLGDLFLLAGTANASSFWLSPDGLLSLATPAWTYMSMIPTNSFVADRLGRHFFGVYQNTTAPYTSDLVTYSFNSTNHQVSGVVNKTLTMSSNANSPSFFPVPDRTGKYVYVWSPIALANNLSLQGYQVRDNADGTFSVNLITNPNGMATIHTAPSAITFSPTDDYAFIVNNSTVVSDSYVMAYKVDSLGRLVDNNNNPSAYKFVNSSGVIVAASMGATEVAVDPTGRYLYAMNIMGDLDSFAITPTGLTHQNHFAVGTSVAWSQNRPKSIYFQPQGKVLYLLRSDGWVDSFRIDTSNYGALFAVSSSWTGTAAPSLSMGFDASGSYAYVFKNATGTLASPANLVVCFSISSSTLGLIAITSTDSYAGLYSGSPVAIYKLIDPTDHTTEATSLFVNTAGTHIMGYTTVSPWEVLAYPIDLATGLPNTVSGVQAQSTNLSIPPAGLAGASVYP